MAARSWPVGLHASLACIWEVTARKPGNVHRYRDFDDVSYLDFMTSAAAIRYSFDRARANGLRVGELIFYAIEATRMVVQTNTNLGMVLLMAPFVRAPLREPVREAIVAALDELNKEDTRNVYKAIRLANPGGLGKVDHEDVSREPTLRLRQAMALAADRDLVARQYANGFREVLDDGVPALCRGLETTGCLEGAIIFCHLSLMAAHPDSLIARKRGAAEAEESSRRARAVLDADWPHAPGSGEALAGLDDWLRGAGRGRNPGTTADLVTASLFVALREQIITLPPAHPWTLPAASDMKNPTLPPPGRR